MDIGFIFFQRCDRIFKKLFVMVTGRIGHVIAEDTPWIKAAIVTGIVEPEKG